MYLPELFQETDLTVLAALMQAHPLASLISTDKQGWVQSNLLPFILSCPDAVTDVKDISLLTHIARSNPLADYVDGQSVLVQFVGAQGYVSPNYYPSKFIHHRHVPTWNYQLVQVRGRVRVFADVKSLMSLLGNLTKTHESTQATPWRMKDAPADYIQEELAHIVGLAIEPEEIVGKFKLSQNREPTDLQGVLDGLGEHNAPLAQAVKDAYRGTTD